MDNRAAGQYTPADALTIRLAALCVSYQARKLEGVTLERPPNVIAFTEALASKRRLGKTPAAAPAQPTSPVAAMPPHMMMPGMGMMMMPGMGMMPSPAWGSPWGAGMGAMAGFGPFPPQWGNGMFYPPAHGPGATAAGPAGPSASPQLSAGAGQPALSDITNAAAASPASPPASPAPLAAAAKTSAKFSSMAAFWEAVEAADIVSGPALDDIKSEFSKENIGAGALRGLDDDGLLELNVKNRAIRKSLLQVIHNSH